MLVNWYGNKIIFIKYLSDNCFNVYLSYIIEVSIRKMIFFLSYCGVIYFKFILCIYLLVLMVFLFVI